MARRADRALDRGVTLIEAMVVVTIVGILVATVAPGFGGVLAEHRVVAAATDVLHALTLARAEAMRRSQRVYVAPIGGRWRDGWLLFVDRNDNRVFDAGIDELIARHDALAPTTTVTNPTSPAREPFTDVGSPARTYVLFDATGYPRQRNGGFSAGSMTFTDRNGAARAVRTLCVAAYGRVRIVEAPSCG